MAFKPNYNFEKAERARAKAQKKQDTLQRQQEEAAKRKADRDGETPGAVREDEPGAA